MDDPDSPFLPHGGYHNLRSYKVAQTVYDATVVFCRRFFPHNQRMTDQMVQAARSGARNISEGSGAAATSRKSEMTLTNVARASLSDELLPDYKSFLTQNGLPVWDKDSRKALAMRARLAQEDAPNLLPARAGQVRLKGLLGLPEFVNEAAPEVAGNAMVCAVNQAAYLLKRQLESQGRIFQESGGFTEKLYRTRSQRRTPDAPACLMCGKPMLLRTARKGPKTGEQFWGCTGYPDCKGTLKASPPKESDKSDQSDKHPRRIP
jgi:four helix bundle suffix protein